MGAILAALAAYPAVVLLIHCALCRLVRPAADRPPQGRAGLAVAGAAAVYLIGAAVLARGRPDFWALLAYTSVFCGCAGCVYFIMFCNTETGRRYHLLRLLLARKQLDVREVRELYSERYIVEKRLERLIAWGALRAEGGRLVVHKRGPLLASRVFHAWSRALGYSWFARGRPAAFSTGFSRPVAPPTARVASR